MTITDTGIGRRPAVWGGVAGGVFRGDGDGRVDRGGEDGLSMAVFVVLGVAAVMACNDLFPSWPYDV